MAVVAVKIFVSHFNNYYQCHTILLPFIITHTYYYYMYHHKINKTQMEQFLYQNHFIEPNNNSTAFPQIITSVHSGCLWYYQLLLVGLLLLLIIITTTTKTTKKNNTHSDLKFILDFFALFPSSVYRFLRIWGTTSWTEAKSFLWWHNI